ncbi:hypothetical protein D6850_11890 [Roseovarius spongiae]|uniref:Uncharacterized protein n=1 Tax=Roseovarius spongiae TaxID=2320272 RepID=A0A3A8AS43_9RHOB|nr:hypothetical protein [Roseovarius spongiae]RKF13887.1 hypothetical protein D6850_11890 [Roseovarius spongiae]
MSRSFIALIMAASLAVTGLTAAPAQAGDKDIARALAAIAGIAIIGAAINDRNKSKRRHDPYASSRGYNQHGHYQQQRRKAVRQHRKAHRQHRKAQRRHHRAERRHHRAERRAYRQGYRQGYRDDQRRYHARPRYAH